MKIQPYKTQILIKPSEKKQVLVSDNKSFCEYGEVVAVGSQVADIKIGDKIGYVIWGLNHLEIDGERHYFVPDDPRFILGIIKDE